MQVYVCKLMASDGKYTSVDLSAVMPEEMTKIIDDFSKDMQRAGLQFTGLEYGFIQIN